MRSSRISSTTRLKFSISFRSPATSVDDPPTDGRSLLDSELVCEPMLGDVLVVSGCASRCDLFDGSSRRFEDRPGDDSDMAVVSPVSGAFTMLVLVSP